jgi:hypothetical protein
MRTGRVLAALVLPALVTAFTVPTGTGGVHRARPAACSPPRAQTTGPALAARGRGGRGDGRTRSGDQGRRGGARGRGAGGSTRVRGGAEGRGRGGARGGQAPAELKGRRARGPAAVQETIVMPPPPRRISCLPPSSCVLCGACVRHSSRMSPSRETCACAACLQRMSGPVRAPSLCPFRPLCLLPPSVPLLARFHFPTVLQSPPGPHVQQTKGACDNARRRARPRHSL